MRLVNMTLFPKENVLMVHCVTYYTVYYARIMALTMLPRMESKKKITTCLTFRYTTISNCMS